MSEDSEKSTSSEPDTTESAPPSGPDVEAEKKRAGSTSADAADDDVVAPVAPAPAGPRSSYVFLGVVAGVTLAADLGSKIWAEHRFEGASGAERRLEIVKSHIAFHLAKNPGGAWGLLGSESPVLRISFFVAISIVAVGFILSLYRRTSPAQRALTWGLPLVLGGALGNLIDRIRYGHVIDFIEVRFGVAALRAIDPWPTFNVADIAIVVGVGLMAIDMFTPRRGPAQGAGSDKAAPSERPAAARSAAKRKAADDTSEKAPEDAPEPS